MGKFAIVVCLVGFLPSGGSAQQADKQGRRDFVPPSVSTATEVVYALQSVVSGTDTGEAATGNTSTPFPSRRTYGRAAHGVMDPLQ